MGIEERKQRLFAAREQEILSTALALFQGEDWRGVTVAQIAEAAGIGKGTVYKHFDSKEAIYAELAMGFFDRLLARVRGLDQHLPPLDWLRQTIRISFDHYLSNSEYRHVVLFCGRPAFRRKLEDFQRQRFTQIDRDFTGMLAAVLARGVISGLFPDRPVMQLAFPLEAAFHGAMQMVREGCVNDCGDSHVNNPPADLTPILQQMEQFMLAGLVYQDRPLT